MAKIPPEVAEDEQSKLLGQHLHRFGRGKVRHSFDLTQDSFLLYTGDNISVFDVVLKARVKDKGQSLNATTVFWMDQYFSGFPNHLVAYGSAIDPHLPEPLRNVPEIQKRSLVVKRCKPFKIECVVRGYLTGSGLKDYNRTGEVCGIKLPPGLHDGSPLPEPIFTPATKAETGHDKNITMEEAADIVGDDAITLLRDRSLEIYEEAASYARENGIIICDTKFEYGVDPGGTICIIDETLTFDSSRIWLASDYEGAQKSQKAPKGYDKQPVRDYMDSLTTPFFKGDVMLRFSQFGPTEEQEAWAHQQEIPQEFLDETSSRSVQSMEKLTRRPLKGFQRDVMKVSE